MASTTPVIDETKKDETKIEEAPPENKDGGEVEIEVDSEDNKDDAEGGEDAQREEAIKLYKALRDPRTAGPLIAALANNAGIKLAESPTQNQIKSEAKSILSIFEEEMGDDYKFLAGKLGKAVERTLTEHAKQTEARFAELAQNQVEAQVDRAYEKLARETKGESKRLETRMARLAEEIPIGTQNVDTYIRRLYTIASGETQKSAAQSTAERIRRNSSDASARIKGSATGTEAISLPDKKMSLQDSVEFALNQQTKGR